MWRRTKADGIGVVYHKDVLDNPPPGLGIAPKEVRRISLDLCEGGLVKGAWETVIVGK